jgi:protein-S-isoprenylcysteine O-methyltransferase Ste14
LNRHGVRGIARELVHLCIHLAVLLLSAGTVGWINAWACAGLDAVRFGWSSMPLWIIAVGVALYGASCAFGSWAMAVNRHFESTVLVRTDGSQTVCSSGPYRIVRHPGYTAGVAGSLSYPCILGSWWAFVPVGVLVLLFIARTALEDLTLRRELPGYREYAAHTRERLVPFVW